MQALQYRALERIRTPRPVDRVKTLSGWALGKRILDLGALDETALEQKQGNGRWLHAELCGSAREVLGIDNSEKLPVEGLVTAPNGRIIKGDIFDLGGVLEEFGTLDALVAGELIEHLPDTLGWLLSLRGNRRLSGVELMFSTPNACSWYNAIVGVAGCESTHQDHLQVYSYKTLRTLFDRSGLDLLELTPYHARFDEMRESSGAVGRVAVTLFQGGVNVLESVFPMLSGGWLGRARIP